MQGPEVSGWDLRLTINRTYFLKPNVFLPEEQFGSPCRVVDGKEERTEIPSESGSRGKMTHINCHVRSLGDPNPRGRGLHRVIKSCLGIWFYLNSRGQQEVGLTPRWRKNPTTMWSVCNLFFPVGENSNYFLDLFLQNGRLSEVTGKNHR